MLLAALPVFGARFRGQSWKFPYARCTYVHLVLDIPAHFPAHFPAQGSRRLHIILFKLFIEEIMIWILQSLRLQGDFVYINKKETFNFLKDLHHPGRGSNPQSSDYKSDALPLSYLGIVKNVGVHWPIYISCIKFFFHNFWMRALCSRSYI